MELTPEDIERMKTRDYWSMEYCSAAATAPVPPQPTTGPNAKGGGLRHDAGKPDYSLVPVRLIASRFHTYNDGNKWRAVKVLACLADWQERAPGGDHLAAAWDYLGGEEAWAECAQVFAFGATKYSAWNWTKGMPWSKPFACAVRHCLAILRGEDTDPESGLPHRGHLACNLVMLLTYAETYPEGDDRAPAGSLAALPQAAEPAFPPIDHGAGVNSTEPVWPPRAAEFTWLTK